MYEETSYRIEEMLPISAERIGYSINGARVTMIYVGKKKHFYLIPHPFMIETKIQTLKFLEEL